MTASSEFRPLSLCVLTVSDSRTLADDTSGDYLFASCGTFERATVYRNASAETDGSWAPVLSDPNMGLTSLAIAPSNPSVVYALAANNGAGVYNQGLLAVFRALNESTVPARFWP